MSDLFVIGASGTRAYRAAMAAVSENIANASTQGYARRSVSTVEANAGGSMIYYSARTQFGGTQVGGVDRATDPYLDAGVRMTAMQLNSASARLRWQSDMENVLNDTPTGVGQLMTTLYQNMDKLAASPSNRSLRVTTLDSIARVAEAFRQTAGDLKQVQSGIHTEAQASVAAVNRALTNLATTNDGLLRTTPGTSAYAQLLDSRDAALLELSANANVEISFADKGLAQVTFAGQTLVSGVTASTLTLAQATDGRLSLGPGSGAPLPAPSSGTLGGLFASAQTASERYASLDALAQQFTTGLNQWHAAGQTDGGTTGLPLLAYSGSPEAMTALLTDPAQLALKSADGAPNGNLLTVSATLRGNGGAEQGWTALIAGHAAMLGATKAEQTTAQQRSDQAVAAREAVSGVDLDMEAADLLRLQQAYSASARVLQIAKETVDSILQII